MSNTDDRWAAGNAYDAYMGRWSRLVAAEFLRWLAPERGADFLELGCGTGALTSTIVASSDPASIVASDQSASFIEHARAMLPDPRVTFVTAGADALPERAGGFDVIVSGVVLNFVPKPDAALAAMRERARPGGHGGALRVGLRRRHRTGPAPAYVASLSEPNRDALVARLRARLPADGDGGIRLRARAWAVRGVR